MWAKNEFDTKSRMNDFSSLYSELALRSPDLTRVLPHILGKCFRNAQYNALAKAELLALSKKYECLKTALLSILLPGPLGKTNHVSGDSDESSQQTNSNSINRVAKL